MGKPGEHSETDPQQRNRKGKKVPNISYTAEEYNCMNGNISYRAEEYNCYEWIKKMQYTHTYIYFMEYYSAIKKE